VGTKKQFYQSKITVWNGLSMVKPNIFFKLQESNFQTTGCQRVPIESRNIDGGSHSMMIPRPVPG